MIYLPILINERRWYVAPFVIKNNTTEIPSAEFVVALKNDKRASLFEVNKEKSQIIRENGENIELDDVEFDKKGIDTTSKKALFQYSLDNNIDYYVEKSNTDDSFKIECNFDHPKNLSKEIILEIIIDKETYVTELVFHLSKHENMFEVVMDFGSEASQMLLKCNDDRDGKIVDILQNLATYHSGNELYKDMYLDFAKERDQIQQHDKDNNFFYKSNFFIVNKRTEGDEVKINYFSTNNSQNDYTNEPFSKNDEPIKVCFNLQEQREFHEDSFAIPNLKVLEKCPWVYKRHTVNIVSTFKDVTAAKQRPFSDEDIRNNVMREIINNFSHAMLKEAIDKIIEKTIEGKINIQFKFFVPNIYTYDKSLKLMKLINDDLKTIVKNNFVLIKGQDNDFKRVKINDFINEIELSIISESDASFLGVFKDSEIHSKINQLNNTEKKVLLIDCGKGTTDISILEIVDGNPISCYRNGIAGAGNIINYGFIEAILKQTKITNQEQYLNALKEIIKYKGNHKAFLDVVEKFKRAYSNENKEINLGAIKVNTGSGSFKSLNTLEVLNENSPIRLNNLVEYIQEHSGSKLANVDHILNNYIDDLSNEIISTIELSGVDFKEIELVLLTGRGFLFKPFYNKIESILHEKLKPKKSLFSFSPKNVKEMIPSLENRINLKNICLYGGLNMKGQYNSDNPTFDIKTLAPSTILSKLGMIKNKKTQKWSRKNLESLESIMLAGITIENENISIGVIKIGGEDFLFNTNDASHTMNLYFVGSINNQTNPYLLKCSETNTKIELTKAPNNTDHIDDKFAIKTLYPHINPEEINSTNGFSISFTSKSSSFPKKFTL